MFLRHLFCICFQVVDFERDVNLVKFGNLDQNLIYQKIVGLKEDLSGPRDKPALLDSNSDTEDETESSNDSEAEGKPKKFVNSSRPKEETAEEKKVNFSVMYLEKYFDHFSYVTEKFLFLLHQFLTFLLQQRKKEVKEQKAEKRKTKIKKHVKKRKEKIHKANSK